MDQSNSAKMAATKARESSVVKSSPVSSGFQSPLDRHLGLIKAIAIILAVLIVAVLIIIVATIYGRVTVTNTVENIQENVLMIPMDSRITGASLTEKGQMLLVIEGTTGQQLWQVGPAGETQRKTRVMQSP